MRNKIIFKTNFDKEIYLKENYPFAEIPKLTDKVHCIHCQKNVIVGDYKVEIQYNEEYICCPNAPECDGTIIDWINVKN
jgi:hypothetical protein